MAIVFSVFVLFAFSISFCLTNGAKSGECMPGPRSQNEFNSWLSGMKEWRQSELSKMKYNDSVYDKFLLWTPSSIVSPQVQCILEALRP